jgi:hypothetical protein
MSTVNLLGRGLCVFILGALSFEVAAAELQSIEVWVQDGRYKLISETLIDADRDDVYAVLVDYDLFKEFTSAIVESNNVEPDAEGRPRFFTRMQGCVLFYCKSFVRRGYLVLTPTHDIVAVAEPERSDFEFSREQWQLASEEEGTVMIYRFELEPRFWVPPVVGPYYIKRELRSGSVRAVKRIEALARNREPAS